MIEIYNFTKIFIELSSILYVQKCNLHLAYLRVIGCDCYFVFFELLKQCDIVSLVIDRTHLYNIVYFYFFY